MSAFATDIAAITARIRAATGPDRVIAALIQMRFRPHASDPKPEEIERIEDTGEELRFIYRDRRRDGSAVTGCWGYHVSRPVTSNLAAVEAFVEQLLPGAYWHVAKGRQTPKEPLYGAAVWLDGKPGSGERDPDVIDEHASSAALAFLLAALEAWDLAQSRPAKVPL